MNFIRSAGVLLHPTSLPGNYGIGDLGADAFRFIDFLESAGQTLWQVLPLGPTGYGDSPYQCFSAFAGNPLLISPDKLVEHGLLRNDDLSGAPQSDPTVIDFGEVIGWKQALLQKAYHTFRSMPDHPLRSLFDTFTASNTAWLDDFALFMALKEHHGGEHWNTWKKSYIHRQASALKTFSQNHEEDILHQKFVQFLFFLEWKEVKSYANAKGIKIIGDLPIFIAYDSADVWANKQAFDVDEDGNLLTKAGVPPDYFSPTGQMWGNPLYRWEAMEQDDFEWWRFRITSLLELVDIIRIDHFRGFAAYWQIPGDAPTAETGKWVKAPGAKLFASLQHHLSDLPILAEDLGLITPDVIRLRDQFNFPGMKILQFAFGSEMEQKFLPHNFIPNCVVYTGSHDNDTTRGYFEKVKTEPNDNYNSALRYLHSTGENLVFELIRLAYASVASIVIIPMQDILNLGSEARMNFPGKLGGNWSWRFTWDQIDSTLPARYKELTEIFERPSKRKNNEQPDQLPY